MYYSECRLIPLDTTFHYTSECYLSPNPRIQHFNLHPHMKNGDINLKDLFQHKLIQLVVNPFCRLIKKWTPIFTDKLNHLASCFAFIKRNALPQPQRKPYEFSSNTGTQVNNEPQTSCSYCATTHPDISLCQFCGLENHVRSICPARLSFCEFCHIRGHFAEKCERRARLSKYCMAPDSEISSIPGAPNLATAITDVIVNGKTFKALVDTGSTECFINEKIANELNLTITPSKKNVSLASSSSVVSTLGSVNVAIQIDNHMHNDFQLDILPNLCCDLILGHNLFVRHT